MLKVETSKKSGNKYNVISWIAKYKATDIQHDAYNDCFEFSLEGEFDDDNFEKLPQFIKEKIYLSKERDAMLKAKEERQTNTPEDLPY